MIALLIATLAGVFVSLPGLADAYTLPQTLWLAVCALAMALRMLNDALSGHRRLNFPLAPSIGAFLGLALLSSIITLKPFV